MKLHLPTGLRAAILACFALVSTLAAPPISATMAGGVAALTFFCAASSAMAEAVQWDANWNAPDAPTEIPDSNVLSELPTGFTFLSAQDSPWYDSATGDTVVLLSGTASGAASVNVIGGAGATTGSTTESEGALTADTWMKVTGGSYATLAGGSYAQNYDGGAQVSFTGDSHILLTTEGASGSGATVDYIIGGNYMDAQNAPFTGNSYISVQSGTVNGSIVGGGTSAHIRTAVFNGNSGIWVYTPLSSTAAARFELPGNFIIGGNAAINNYSPTLRQVGDSQVTVDLSAAASGSGAMEKSLVGGAWLLNNSTSTQNGNSSVSIKGADSSGANVSFAQPVVAGAWFAGGGSSSQSGNTSLTVEGGSFSGPLVGGNYLASGSSMAASSTIGGNSTMTLGGGLEMSGTDAIVIGGSYVAASSATLQSGKHSITIDGGTYAGNVMGGSYITSGDGVVTQKTGDIAITVNGGTLNGTLYGGSCTANNNAGSVSEHGAVSISLLGGSINGNVYAGGGVEGTAFSSVTVASTQVEIGNAATLGSITISGGMEGSSDASTVTGDSTLLLSGSSAYSNLASATFEDFNVVNNASDATLALATSSDSFTKQGAGALSLSGGADALASVSQLSISAGSLDTGASTLTQGGMGLSAINVAAGASLSTAALTLADGAALTLALPTSVGSQALVGVTGALSLLGDKPVVLTLSGLEGLAAGGSATLLSWGSATTPISLEQFNWSKGYGNEPYELVLDGNSLVLKRVEELVWDDSGTWTAGPESDGKAAVFEQPTAGDAVVSVSGMVEPQSIVVTNDETASYTLEAAEGGGSIGGATSLTKYGEGTLIMNLDNTYSGGTIINAGTVEAAAEGTAGTSPLGSGAVTLNGGTLLASAQNAIAANAIEMNGGALSYTADETRELGTAGISHAAGVVPEVSVGADATVTWQYADAAALEAAVTDGVELSGGGTLRAESTADGTASVLSGPISLADEGTTLEFAGPAGVQLGSTASPIDISLEEGSTLRLTQPETADSTVAAALSGEGTLEIAAGSAAATGTVLLSGNNEGFAGNINLGSSLAADTPIALAADAPAVVLDYSEGSPVGGAESTLNMNGLSFAIVQNNGTETTTAAQLSLNADTTQYAQTAGLNNSFSGALAGASGLSWTLDTTLVAGGQTNTLTGSLAGFEGTLAARGMEGSIARWVLTEATPASSAFAVTPGATLPVSLSAANEYNEFVLDYAQDVTLSGAVSGSANVTQQGAGTLVLTGTSDSTGSLSIDGGSSVQLGGTAADAAATWGNAAGSELAGNGTLNLVNGTLNGPLSMAAGSSPVVNLEAAAGCTVNLGGNGGELLNGSFLMQEGSFLTGVGSSILDKELDMTLGEANIGQQAAGEAMVQFADSASSTQLGSTTADIHLELSATNVVNLLSQHRVEGVDSYLTLTNGELLTAADYSNIIFGQNMDILHELGLRISSVTGGAIVLSGTASGVYFGGTGSEPIEVTGYQNFGAFQAVAVMPGQTLTLTLDGAPDIVGESAVVNNLLGGEGSAFVVNNTDTTGEVALVTLNNTLQFIDPIPEGLPGDPTGADTTFGGSIGESADGGDVEFVKTGDGTLTVAGAFTAHQLTAQQGGLTLLGEANSFDTIALEGGAVQLGNSGTTTAATLEDGAAGGSLSIAEGATLVVSGTGGRLENASLSGPGTLRVTGELALAEEASLNEVALELADGTLSLEETAASQVSALKGSGILNGTGSTADTGLSITGTGGSFGGALTGNGTLTVAAGAEQAFSSAFSGGAGWNLVNNGSMSLDFVTEARANSPLTLNALNLGADSVTNIRLDLSAPTEGTLTLGSISVEPSAVVRVSSTPSDDIVNRDATYTIGLVTGGQAAGVLTSVTPVAEGITFMLLDPELSNLSVDAAGNLQLNLVTSRTNKFMPLSSNPNSATGAALLWNAAFSGNTAVGTDIRRLLERIDAGGADADRILAAVSGASTSVLSAAFASDLERQLRGVRNRSTLLPVSSAVAACKGAYSAAGPRYAAWIQGEGDHRKMKADGFMPGYSLSSWGGTVGMDVACSDGAVAGLALTAMYGDLDAHSADHATGDFDRYYISAFAKMKQQRWNHTLLGTVGRLDAKLDRSVDFGSGSYYAHGSTKGWGYGVMYEIAYDLPVDEGAMFTLQPVANVSWRYADIDGYGEYGSDAALRVDGQDYNVVTFGAGLRTQAEVGSRWFNRKARLDARALVKVDTGDRSGEARVAMLGGGGRWGNVRSEKLSAVGVELGAGLTIPMGEGRGALFIDGSAELRNEYSNLNGTLGYRFEF